MKNTNSKFNVGKKVKTTVSIDVHNLIKEDGEYFGKGKAGIANILFRYYSNKELDITKIEKPEITDTFQFNLDKENTPMCNEIIKSQGNISEADYLRIIFYDYAKKPRYVREEIIFENNISKIIDGITEQKKIALKYDKEIRKVSPYTIKYGNVENSNYLFCYCHSSNKFKTYRISRIEDIVILKEDLETINPEYIEEVFKNFDPFLSYGYRIKVKLTNKGKELLKIILNNKPKLLENKEDIYTFECSPLLAEVYFSRFLDEVEILEPLEIRDRFKRIYEKLAEVYKGGNNG